MVTYAPPLCFSAIWKLFPFHLLLFYHIPAVLKTDFIQVSEYLLRRSHPFCRTM
jgi:hypothetical protein